MVDDNVEIADLLVDILRKHGYEVSVAYGGTEALRATLILRPDAVVLDLSMPELDGFTVAVRLRQRHHSKNIILIAYSSWRGNAVMIKAFASGFNHYICKPDDVENLLQIIATI